MEAVRTVRLERVDPVWAVRKFTVRKSAALVTWWVMCMIIPPLFIIGSGIVGMLNGAMNGMIRGAVESYHDLRQWWTIFEES